MKLSQLHEQEERSVLSVMGEQDAHIDGSFVCDNKQLTSLVGAPTSVGGNFYSNYSKLTSLVGAPTEVGGNFHCSNNKLTSLAGIHKQIKKISGMFSAAGNPRLKSNLLGLLLIDGITEIEIDDEEIAVILNRHLLQPNKKLAMLQCQQELIEAGFDEAAQL